ncbi:hypothetical protein AMELA_G00033970 [Ameiurus melas]|uniref:PDZ domain-containing protein n=1 Tax=Ameiurus melas TaxID=219545 RepID=A0A7J6B851_AMEME|nr:hypothetical protein AMELA_G00033970 [Ameiurus melas]
MSKSLKKKNHWTNKVHEAVLTRNKEGELGFELRGGAENGNFPYFGEVKHGKVAIQSGKLCADELLLEVNDTPVAGLTTRDVLAVIKHCKDPFRLKCVKQVKKVKITYEDWILTAVQEHHGHFESWYYKWNCPFLYGIQLSSNLIKA